MSITPLEIIKVIRPFAQVFSARVWDWVPVLVAGAMLAPGNRTVTADGTVSALDQHLPCAIGRLSS
jgi:hypothetical protein